MTDRGLLNQTGNDIESDRSIAKIVILAAIAIVFSFLFSYFLKSAVLRGGSNFSILSFSAASIFLAFYFLNVIFIKSLWRVNLIILLESLAFLLVFYDMFSLNILLGALAAFLVLLWGSFAGRDELENTLKVKFWRIGKRVIPKGIFALALFVGVVYAGAAIGQNEEFPLSQSAFEKLVGPVLQNGLVQNFLPGLDINLPTSELFKNLAEKQVEGNQQLNLLPAAAKNELIGQAAAETQKRLSEFLGVTLNSNLNILTAIYDAGIKKFASLSDNAKMAVPITLAVLLFLTIVGLTLPIRWLIALIAFLFYEIFLALGFTEVTLEGRSREIILLK